VNDTLQAELSHPTVGEALRRLRAAQKPGAGAPVYSRWVNRPLGRVFAAVAASRGMRPNQVTAVSAVCTFSALTLVALTSPQWWLGPVVALLLLLGYALDAADGQLARLRGGGSRSGEWFDHVVDATKVSVLHCVVLISFYRFTDASDLQLLVAVGFQVVSSVFFFSMVLIDLLRRTMPKDERAARRGGRGGTLQSIAGIPTDYAVLCLCFSLLGWQSLFRPAYSALFVINAVVLTLTLGRWWREVKSMDGA
jgi:phosphatidylglycerophosphate synthase